MADKDPWAKIGARLRAVCDAKRDAPSIRDGEGWSGAIGGFCPVQGEGTVDGLFWYFRARHDAWSFEVWNCPFGPDGALPQADPIWSAEAEYDEGDGDAGWMPFSTAWEIIEASIATGRDTGWSMPSRGTP